MESVQDQTKRSPEPETIKIQPGQDSAVAGVDEKVCAVCDYCYGKKDGEDLHCRRFPPTVYYNVKGGVAETKFPGVSTDFSCGEFKDE